MEIKEIYIMDAYKYDYVIESTDNKFYKFRTCPQRKITEKDLKEIFPNISKKIAIKYLKKLGDMGGCSMERIILNLYGLEKISSEG